MPLELNLFLSRLKIVDCGDILTLYDNVFVIQHIENGHRELLHRTLFSALPNGLLTGTPLVPIAKDGKHRLRVIMLGGDHMIVLPLLRSIQSAYDPSPVIHFDSHLDTWKLGVFGSAPSEHAAINHEPYFYWASRVFWARDSEKSEPRRCSSFHYSVFAIVVVSNSIIFF